MKNEIKKKLISFLFFLLVLIFGYSTIFSQVSHSVSFSKNSFHNYSFKSEDSDEYQTIKMDNLNPIDREVGLPELPVKVVRLIVPAGQKVSNIIYSTSNKEIIKLQKPVNPVQYDIPTSIDYEKRPFVKPDKKVYESDHPYPEKLVKVLNDGYFDGANHIVEVAVYPAAYFPKENKLELYQEISFTLIMANGGKQPFLVNNRSLEKQQHIDKVLKTLVDNPQDIQTYQVKHKNLGVLQKTNSVPSGNFDYVIVTTNALSSAFDKFIQWKKRKGIRIYIKTIEDIIAEYPPNSVGDHIITGGIPIYDHAGSLRQFLSETKETNDIQYALLAGERADIPYTHGIPYRYGCGVNNQWYDHRYWDYRISDWVIVEPIQNQIPADLYFSDFDGDWNKDGLDVDGEPRYGEMTDDDPDYYPEIFVGRLLFRTQQEVLDWTDKLIEYEQNPFHGNYDRLTRFLWSQSDQLQHFSLPKKVIESSSVLLTFTQDTISEMYHGSLSYNSLTPDAPTGADIINQLNNGYHFYNIYNHGEFIDILVRCQGDHATLDYKTGYQYGVFCTDGTDEHNDENEIGNGLDNIQRQNRSTIIYSVGCDNVQYDNSIAYNFRTFGDAFTTLSNSGGVAFLGNTRVGWVNSSDSLHIRFIDCLYDNSPRSFHLGEAEALSKSNNSYDKHYLAYTHNLFGDPEMPVWTATPSQFTSSVTDGSGYVTVNAGVGGCIITAKSIDDTYYESSAFHDPTGNGVSTYTFNINTRPLYITITKENYIPYTAILGGSIASNTTFTGRLNVLGNLTVQSGATLTIDPEPGTVLNFRNNSKLVVNGILNASGTAENPITFDFISPNSSAQNGIKINSYGSIISYCNISNAQYGIFQNSANCNISHNNMSNCYIGIYTYNTNYQTGDTYISHNRIFNSSLASIYSASSTPFISNNELGNTSMAVALMYGLNSGTTHATEQTIISNYFHDCIDGIYAYNTAYFRGYNNIVENTVRWNMITMSNCAMFAENNWWGSDNYSTISSKIIDYGGTSYIDFDPWLHVRPTPSIDKIIPVSNQIADNQNTAEGTNLLLDKFKFAQNLVTKKDLSSAKNICLEIINGYPDSLISVSALNLLWYLSTGSDLENFKTYLKQLYSNKDKKDLYASAGIILSSYEKDRLKSLDLVIDKYRGCSVIDEAMMDKFLIHLHEEEDIKKADETFKDLQKSYPKSVFTSIAGCLLYPDKYSYKDIVELNVGKNDQKEGNIEKVKIPDEYDLKDNYPNPFNPNTTIKYALPQNSQVTLEVYNMLGEKVAVLVNEVKAAGYHEAVFNGTNLSSGIYIYRLTASSLETGKQFVKSAKMMLVK